LIVEYGHPRIAPRRPAILHTFNPYPPRPSSRAIPSQAQSGTPYSNQRKLRLAYFVTHPIQYQAPLLRRIAQEPDIDLKVFFSSNHSVRGYVDKGFGVHVQWDTPLLDGYNYEFLPVVRDAQTEQFLGSIGPINRGIKRKLQDGKFDAVWVHGYNYLTNLQAIRVANSMRIPVLLRAESTLHDRPRSETKLAIKKLFFNWLKPKVSAVLSIGEENNEYWKHNFGHDFPTFPCYYSVDNQFFQHKCAEASETRNNFRTSLSLDPGRPIILFAAKLIPRKRCGDLLEAYLQLSKSGNIQPYLIIIGDGEQRAMLEARANQANRRDIRFLGFRNQSELPRFYDLCNVFVLASVDEPWGLAINEVMNAGRPVIVTDQVGCQKNLVHPAVNGYVIRAGDVDALAQSLQTILASEQTAQAMGAESLRIIAAYNFDQNVSGLRQALHAVAPSFRDTIRLDPTIAL
jgi:glycosyltransferase involved in cell wall biosynthesis